jgi:hypothetical protein
MRGSDFVRQFASAKPAAWESAALDLARRGQAFAWPLAAVSFSNDAHTLIVQVASDYFAIGEEGDVLRLPLTPLSAQRVADALGMLLPTPKMVKAIHEQAAVKLTTQGLVPNRYANLAQYAEQNARVEAELAGRRGLTSGHKKDVVLGNQMRAGNVVRPGNVLIYGWMRPIVPPGVDAFPMMTAPEIAPKAGPWRVQPYSGVHGDDYVDYSHGIRLVAPDAVLDGKVVQLEEVMQSPALARLISDEGPLRATRYPVPKSAVAASAAVIPKAPRLVDQGLAWIQEQVIENKVERL